MKQNCGCAFAWILCGLVLAATHAWAADLFVAPGTLPGEGTRANPFNDPWRALAAATPGDQIHIAEGSYYGRFDRSSWVVDRPNITVLGGYDRGFASRNPWKRPSVLAFFRGYEGPSENNLLTGMGDHRGLVLDGLVFDGEGRSRYETARPHARQGGLQMVTALVGFDSPDIVIRNCTFLNSATGGITLNDDNCRFENNIVINHLSEPMLSLREKNRSTRRPMIIKGNTFAFAHDDTDPPMGKGGEKGVGIRVGSPAVIEQNLFVACGNAAINVFAKPADVSIDRNIFCLMTRADVAARLDGREMVITDKNLEEMEDLGFKSCKDNKAADANLTGLPKEWVAGVTRQILFSYATPPKDGLAKFRESLGLGEAEKPTADNDRGPSAPRLAPAEAAALTSTLDAGAKPVELKVAFSSDMPAATVAGYARVGWAELAAGIPEGKLVEFVCAIGNESNSFVLRGLTADKYLGFHAYYPGGEQLPEMMHFYMLRNGPAHRQWEETSKSNGPRAEDFYTIRGIAHSTGARQKTTIEVRSVTPGEMPAAKTANPPKGKEWFVKAGSSGGDGSRGKPFRDPFQALEKATDGDTIRVAGGDYFGKLRTANWKVVGKYVSLLGGYDTEFAARDPWKNPTRLVLPADADKTAKSNHGGTFLASNDINEGLVVDGFVFDGSTVNGYFDKGGALNVANSPVSALVQLRGPNITLRNCLFANASGLAVDLGSASGTFENNVIANTSGVALKINAMGPGPWLIRRNTILFSMDPTERGGTGRSTLGTHLMFSGRAAVRIEENVLAFADSAAIRITVPREKVSLTGNIFAANLYCHLTDSQRVWLHDAVFERRLADAGYVAARGNQTTLSGSFPLDKAYGDNAMTRLIAMPGKVTPDQWKAAAMSIGATVSPGGASKPVAEETKDEQPKETSVDDLLKQLEQIKIDKPAEAEAPKGPAYAPAYPWNNAVDLAREGETPAGARRIKVAP